MPAEPATHCPLPFANYPNIVLAHGGGGRLTRQLIAEIFLPAFHNPHLDRSHDGAELVSGGSRLAFTTDSYVVQPLFFPGGDIGALAVNGTVNDLAMCGARPKWLSAGFILEEGLPMQTLQRVVRSMQETALAAGVTVVTGDTKVVEKGKADGLFINTAGVGVIEHDVSVNPAQVRPGDAVLLNGDLGRHGMAILSARADLGFDPPIQSDCASLAGPVLALLDAGVEVHCLRDLTRGGLASALNEIADAATARIVIDENLIPVSDGVRGACEILGLDPLYVANEGRFVAFVPAKNAPRALEVLRSDPLGQGACLIGAVTGGTESLVTIKSRIGVERVLDMLSGEQLPRIC